MDNSDFFNLPEVVVGIFFSLKNHFSQCQGFLICRSELEAQRIILAKASHIRTSSAKASLALFHTTVILMNILGNIARMLSCGRASVWKVLSKWHSQSFQLLFIQPLKQCLLVSCIKKCLWCHLFIQMQTKEIQIAHLCLNPRQLLPFAEFCRGSLIDDEGVRRPAKIE